MISDIDLIYMRWYLWEMMTPRRLEAMWAIFFLCNDCGVSNSSQMTCLCSPWPFTTRLHSALTLISNFRFQISNFTFHISDRLGKPRHVCKAYDIQRMAYILAFLVSFFKENCSRWFLKRWLSLKISLQIPVPEKKGKQPYLDDDMHVELPRVQAQRLIEGWPCSVVQVHGHIHLPWNRGTHSAPLPPWPRNSM